MKVYYVCSNPVTPVVESQVIENIIQLRNKGVDVGLLLLMQTRSFLPQWKRSKKEYKGEPYSVSTWLVPMQYKTVGRIIGFLVLCGVTIRHSRDEVIFHCRGLNTSFFANKVRRYFSNAHVICDVRGDYVAERQFRGNEDGPVRALKKIESFCIKSSDYSLFVSNYLRKVVTSRCGYPRKSEVLPCAASKERIGFSSMARDRTRSAMGISDRMVFLYSGSVDRWHCFAEVIGICEILQGALDNAYFIFLTNQREKAEKEVALSTVADCSRIESVPSQEVGAYLSAADGAIIAREPHPLNYAASPVKVAEYILNGLPVIISDSIKDYSELISQTGIGVVLDATRQKDKSYLKSVLGKISSSNWIDMRGKYDEEITKKLSKEYTVDRIKMIYETIAKK